MLGIFRRNGPQAVDEAGRGERNGPAVDVELLDASRGDLLRVPSEGLPQEGGVLDDEVGEPLHVGRGDLRGLPILELAERHPAGTDHQHDARRRRDEASRGPPDPRPPSRIHLPMDPREEGVGRRGRLGL